MSKTYRDKPAKEREIFIKKHERGDRRKMDPYSRKRNNSWDQEYY